MINDHIGSTKSLSSSDHHAMEIPSAGKKMHERQSMESSSAWKKTPIKNGKYAIVERASSHTDSKPIIPTIAKINYSLAFENKVNKLMCGMCNMYFDAESMEYQVPKHRIVEYQKIWKYEGLQGRRYETASYLYTTVRVCTMCSQFFEDTEDGGGEALMSPTIRPKTTSVAGSGKGGGGGGLSMMTMMDVKHRSRSGSASPMTPSYHHSHLTQSPARTINSYSNNHSNSMTGTPNNQKIRRPQQQLLSPLPQQHQQQQQPIDSHNLSTPQHRNLSTSTVTPSSSSSASALYFPGLPDTTTTTTPLPTATATATLLPGSPTPTLAPTTPFSKSKPRQRPIPTVISTGSRSPSDHLLPLLTYPTLPTRQHAYSTYLLVLSTHSHRHLHRQYEPPPIFTYPSNTLPQPTFSSSPPPPLPPLLQAPRATLSVPPLPLTYHLNPPPSPPQAPRATRSVPPLPLTYHLNPPPPLRHHGRPDPCPPSP